MRFLYHYNIHYTFKGGQGAARVQAKRKIDNRNISDLEDGIKDKLGENVLIVNYQLLRKQRVG